MTLYGGRAEEIDSHGLSYSFGYSTSGTTFVQAPICGFSTPGPIAYTATASTLTFFSDDNTFINVFTKQ